MTDSIERMRAFLREEKGSRYPLETQEQTDRFIALMKACPEFEALLVHMITKTIEDPTTGNLESRYFGMFAMGFRAGRAWKGDL